MEESVAANYVIEQLCKLGFSEIQRKNVSAYAWRRYCPYFAEGYIVRAKYCCYGLTPLKVKWDLPIVTTKVSLAPQLRNQTYEAD